MVKDAPGNGPQQHGGQPAVPDDQQLGAALLRGGDDRVDRVTSPYVDRLEDIRRDLVATGPTPKLQTQLSETLAVLRVLARIALRDQPAR
ncbi:hypothetical protein [Kribbella sp. NBC_00889]|uniref:hypothetical protein n=1 Tax=Kribbella sp. NBC_00889 TaxID=2975974 RepID=UPI00386F5CB7|nr:hypothetical protein OG817_13470 [Kribbella sp. NBC_00889]